MLGGLALKQVTTRRYSKEEFNNIIKEIEELFKNHWSDIIWSVTISYSTKETFGDLDLLVLRNGMSMEYVREKINEIFKPSEVYRNGNCISFDYKELQIDIILIEESEWKTSNVYFSYNDLGNFMGRTARDLGFRYGAYGLAYDFDGGGRIIVSNDVEKIFTFLGYDYQRYLKGFSSMEEIFKYVIESKYFRKESFAYENLNNINRSRNLKRKSYVSFMEYIQNIDNGNHIFESKEKYLEYALKFFSGNEQEESFSKKLSDYHDIELIKEESKNLFNGKLINEYFPSIDKRDYGHLIKNYKDSVRTYLSNDSDDRNLTFEIYTLEVGKTYLLMKEFALVNKLKSN